MKIPARVDPHTTVVGNSTYIENQSNTNYNINHSNVTVNIVRPSQGASNSAAQLIAVENFSKEYYQLLVTGEEDAFNKNYVTVPKEYALSRRYVPAEILGRCSSLSEEGVTELKTFPAIICMENENLGGVAGSNQCAIYAYITQIKKESQAIKVAFCPIAPIPQKVLCEKKYAVCFDLNMDCVITDLNCCAWSVHKVNLFEAFKEAGLENLPFPSQWR